MEAARFFAVAVAGLVLDVAVAWSAARLLGLPLWLAAATGFAVAAAMNYVLHELYPFRHGARRLSAVRVLRYAMALAATMIARVATVAALAAVVGEGQALLVLLAGASVSFGVNFLISKFFVFRSSSHLNDPLP